MRTEEHFFYHATSRTAGNAILASGVRRSYLEEIGAFRLGNEIRSALLRHAKLSPTDDYYLLFAFKCGGADFGRLKLEHQKRVH